jgi:hypothetical protein
MKLSLETKTHPQPAGPVAWQPQAPSRLAAGLLAIGAALATLGAAIAPAALGPTRHEAAAGHPPAVVVQTRPHGEPA